MRHAPLTRQQVLDQYFVDARHKLIDIAAFLDRADRAEGDADFRLAAFRTALKQLAGKQPLRAKNVLLSFSDPSTKPIAKAHSKGATGAWPGE
ncbi:MAG: hypothetical protein EXS24_03745 [Pedosphaera sp.]|nr:hypothetical protein [Pedosphaera sp.]